MNLHIVAGKLTKDPETKILNNNKRLCEITIADNARSNTEFLNCIAWDAQADIIQKHTKKGDNITVSGYITNRTWKDENGKTHVATRTNITDITLMGVKQHAPLQNQNPYYSVKTYEEPVREVINDNDSIDWNE